MLRAEDCLLVEVMMMRKELEEETGERDSYSRGEAQRPLRFATVTTLIAWLIWRKGASERCFEAISVFIPTCESGITASKTPEVIWDC